MPDIKTKNRYYKHSRISEAKFRQIIRGFSMDLNATETAELTSISVRSINSIYLKIRQSILEINELESPYPADTHAMNIYSNKMPLALMAFGIYQQDEKIHTELLKPELISVLKSFGRREPRYQRTEQAPKVARIQRSWHCR